MTLVTAPTTTMLDTLSTAIDGVEIALWDLIGPPPAARIDMVIAPYMAPAPTLAPVAEVDVAVLHLLSIGYDGVRETIGPDPIICNAAGAHEEATAELALAMILADRRGLHGFIRAQDRSSWEQRFTTGLRNQRALIIGAGAIGSALARRLLACGVSVTRAGRTARNDELGTVVAMSDVPDLLPTTDIVALAVPLDSTTRHLVDSEFLRALPDGALIVNVARGPVVDTKALVEELSAGRLSAALDVVDPEPLPADHPLWGEPRALILPHVGGRVSSMQNDLDGLLIEQIGRLRDGRALNNVLHAP